MFDCLYGPCMSTFIKQCQIIHQNIDSYSAISYIWIPITPQSHQNMGWSYVKFAILDVVWKFTEDLI